MLYHKLGIGEKYLFTRISWYDNELNENEHQNYYTNLNYMANSSFFVDCSIDEIKKANTLLNMK